MVLLTLSAMEELLGASPESSVGAGGSSTQDLVESWVLGLSSLPDVEPSLAYRVASEHSLSDLSPNAAE